MNEVTKIHLGRQAFTISVDAHHELRSYLDAIKKQVDDKDVVEEIELRMAELLIEHGITGNKVVLLKDVSFLIKQLGDPKEFNEDGEEPVEVYGSAESKRLFRDIDNAMLAGVAAGLSKYLGLDVVLVRILFIIFTLITAGWGILLYIILWLLVPEARTSSDKLRMAGKPVTVDSLKEVVERTDVKGAAKRANATLVTPINGIFRVLLKLIGLFFIVSGLSALFGLIATEIYILLHGSSWSQYNIFPIGLREHVLLDIAFAVVALIAVFVILFGIAIFRRKWPIRTWVTGILIGLIFIGLAVGGSLAADVYPEVHNRYLADVHTTVRSLASFNQVNVNGNDANINFVNSNKNYVTLNYYGSPNLSTIVTKVNKGTLTIDTSQFNWQRNCPYVCIPNSYNMIITVYSPNALQFSNQDFVTVAPSFPPGPMYNHNMQVNVHGN
jgi:phage shock protein PspC (stress-responsive transcriptional regulator)